MRAITVIPGQAGSARFDDVPEPPLEDGPVLVQTMAVGVCGTDVEILSGAYGWAPPGRERLILGHESLGRVLEAPAGCGLGAGDLVAGVVRRADPVPCDNCAVGEWDMCKNGQYTERGIKQRDGFASERFRIRPEHAIRVDSRLAATGVLMEPASVVAKAWEHVERIGARARWTPHRVLVTGAGPIGLLAALFASQRRYEVHVLDRATGGPKPQLVRDLGATYHTGPVAETCDPPDIVIECTGVASLVLDVLEHGAPGSIICLAGVSSGGHALPIDLGAINREMVLDNQVVFGSVNANRRHYEQAATALAAANPTWLGRLITRRVPSERWQEALARQPDDVKPVIEFAA